TGLADGNHQRVFVDDRIAITKFTTVIHFDRNLRQPLDHEFPREGRMPARSTRDYFHLTEIAEFLLSEVHFIEKDFARFLRDPSEQGIAHGTRLLEDFLLHEMVEAAFFRHDRVPRDGLDLWRNRVIVEIDDADTLQSENRDFSVAHEEGFARVRKDRGNIASDKKFILAQTDHHRRPEPRRDNLVRVARGHRHKSVSTVEEFYGFLHSVFQRNVLRIFLDDMRDDFRVRLGLKLVPFGDQLVLQLEVVL